MLFFIPGCTYTQISTPMRQDIQGCDCLDQKTWMTIGDTSNHCTEFDTVCATSSKGERTIAFEHFVFGRPYVPNLEEVIHYPHAVETCAFSSLGNKAKGIAEVFLAIGPGDIWDL